MTAAILQASGLSFAYPGHPVLHGVDLEVRPGEAVALLGANGTGKSTLLRILMGFARPSAGYVRLDGRDLASFSRRRLARRMAYVPQGQVCPFPYRVREIVAMGLFSRRGLFGRADLSGARLVERELDRLGIASLAERPYTEISGGERQLAQLCRALVQGASLLVMDEPAASLDFGNQARLLSQVRRLAGEGYSVIMTTHHPGHALMAANRVVMMKDGSVMAEGPTRSTLTEASLRALYGISPADLAALMGRLGSGSDAA